jgi:hypothetical protein
MQRTQKDIDIIRQSSLKAAVELTVAMLPRLENQTEISNLVLKVANKFSNWVIQPAIPVENSNQPRQQPPPQATGIASQIQDFKTMLAREPDLYRELSGLDREHASSRWIDRPSMTFGAGPGDPYPISKKQFGFLVGLHKKLGIDPDPEFINGLSSRGASKLIEELQAIAGDGGNGQPNLSDIKGQIQNRLGR